MTKPNVYVTRPLPPESLQLLMERCTVEMEADSNPLPKDKLLAKLKGRDAILITRTKIDEEICQAIKSSCKILANYGVGYDNIDVNAATKCGMYVTYNPGVVTDATADLTFALILAIARRIVECDAYVRSGRKDWGPNVLLATEVSGKTLGIVGGGRVGLAVGQRAKGFNMNIIYTDVKPNQDFEKATGGSFVDKQSLLKNADFITLHVPLLESTRHYIGASELTLMKKTAILVNASRGPVVDEKALLTALQSGKIRGAGLDVFEREPELEPGLAKLANVVLTPHVGTSTMDTRIKMGDNCARSIFAALDGKVPPNCANPEAKSNR
jgi:lactate dehydrogenase-like 2-hydroxyacid dehydrogenase